MCRNRSRLTHLRHQHFLTPQRQNYSRPIPKTQIRADAIQILEPGAYMRHGNFLRFRVAQQ